MPHVAGVHIGNLKPPSHWASELQWMSGRSCPRSVRPTTSTANRLRPIRLISVLLRVRVRVHRRDSPGNSRLLVRLHSTLPAGPLCPFDRYAQAEPLSTGICTLYPYSGRGLGKFGDTPHPSTETSASTCAHRR